MGEAVLKDIATKHGLDTLLDTCGTAGYYVGEEPDERTVETCRKVCPSYRCAPQKLVIPQHGVPIDSHARQLSTSNIVRFTCILVADESNLRNIRSIKPANTTAEVRLWGSYLDNKAIPDPYYGGLGDFEKVYQQCVRFSDAFLDEVVGKKE